MMKRLTLTSSMVISLLLSGSTYALDQKQVYGSQLMTERERVEHRYNMQNAGTEAERNKIRNEHHKRMQKRAKEKGISLPDKPPANGRGYGGKNGSGSGAGKRDGSGPGKGKGGGKGSGMER